MFYEAQQYQSLWYNGSKAFDRLDAASLSHSSYVVVKLYFLRKDGQDLSELTVGQLDKMSFDLSSAGFKIDSIALGLYGASYGVKETSEPTQSGNKLKLHLQQFGGMTTKEATAAAKKLGYTKTNFTSHGQPVFKKGNKYITPDVDGHNGGIWKMADSVKNLGSKSTRMGTYDENLTWIGD